MTAPSPPPPSPGPADATLPADAALPANARLDVTGLLCPLPVLKARKHLLTMAAGESLDIASDDPASVIDFAHFCAQAGHDLVSQTKSNGVFHFRIRRGFE